MTRTPLLLAAAFAALLSGCSSHLAAPAAPTAAASTASLPPGCASALADLPKSAPDTEQQATSDFDALSAGTADTTAASLANDVGADSLSIEFDLSTHLPVAKDVAEWETDATALRSYCD
jgi:hypothetical protein